MQINRGMFQQNGNCGYVLKPKVLLDRSNDEFVFCPIDSTQIKHVFTIEVCPTLYLQQYINIIFFTYYALHNTCTITWYRLLVLDI